MIIYGVKPTTIDLDEFLIKCPSCEQHSWADVMVIGKYFHIFWVPVFPTEKYANVICKTCGIKRYGMSFDSSLISNYNEIKRKFRYPWFTYIGIGFMIFFFISIVLATIF